MKDTKFVRSKSWGFSIHSPRGLSGRKPCRAITICVFALLMIFMIFGAGNVSDMPQTTGSAVPVAKKVHVYDRSVSVNPARGITPSKRDTSFSFLPKVINLDAQRKAWWKDHQDVRAGRPKVLIVTGSDPIPCERPIDTHMYLKSAKNKVHYSRMHDFQMHYSLIEPHKNVVGRWNKLPVLRMQMLAHPEVEWFWWMDSEVVITDMESELPLEEYERFNFVVYGDEHRVLELKDWKALNTRNFLIRNCQWSLDLLDAWGSMGDVHQRDHVEDFLSTSLPDRPQGMGADDQSALVYLLSTEKAVWSAKTHLEKEVFFTADWRSVTEKLEEIEKMGHGNRQWPVTIDFSGCSRCGVREGAWPWDECKREMERAMDFADNQVYRRYGFEFRGLGIPELVPVPGHVPKTVVTSPEPASLGEFRGFKIHKLPGPFVEHWDAQRESWFQKNPDVKKVNDHGLPKTMIVTGSSTKECAHSVGGHGLLQAIKNKVDYARFHDMSIFYGQVDFDVELDYWWTKIPTIRVLMLSHPEVEWFWWCDGDAAVTDMVFDPPYQKFDDNGYNLVLYGDYDLLRKKNWIALNAGIFLVRNCQWTLDFFDIWASFGIRAVRPESGRVTTEALVGRDPLQPGEDQSTLIYLLVTDKDKEWAPKIRLERDFTMSGYWKRIGPQFESMQKQFRGTGGENWPWITHFAGCQPCGDKIGNFDVEKCRSHLVRAFDFADNQVLEQYGLVHSSLGNPEVRKLKAWEKR